MKEFLQSLSSFSLAMCLFPIREAGNLLAGPDRSDGRSPAVVALDAVTSATKGQLGGTLNAVFSALDNTQRGLIALAMSATWPLRGWEGARADSGTSTPHSRVTRPVRVISDRSAHFGQKEEQKVPTEPVALNDPFWQTGQSLKPDYPSATHHRVRDKREKRLELQRK